MEKRHTKEIEVVDRYGDLVVVVEVAMAECFSVTRHEAREDSIAEVLGMEDLATASRGIEKGKDIGPF